MTNLNPPAARLTAHEAGLIRELLEEGLPAGEIIAKFDRMVERQRAWRTATQQR